MSITLSGVRPERSALGVRPERSALGVEPHAGCCGGWGRKSPGLPNYAILLT
jgi:hypothetical protein